jgi:hypothetical protein
MTNQNGSVKEFNWSLPRLTPQEKYFVSQIISSPTKDVKNKFYILSFLFYYIYN